jgi:hypothetical protein
MEQAVRVHQLSGDFCCPQCGKWHGPLTWLPVLSWGKWLDHPCTEVYEATGQEGMKSSRKGPGSQDCSVRSYCWGLWGSLLDLLVGLAGLRSASFSAPAVLPQHRNSGAGTLGSILPLLLPCWAAVGRLLTFSRPLFACLLIGPVVCTS